MRHRVAGWKLGRNTSHRRALLRNLVTSLIMEERIETSVVKAKAMRPHVERMITLRWFKAVRPTGLRNIRIPAGNLPTKI